MANSTMVVAVLVALCQLLAIATSEDLIVKGSVYCDTCRVQFKTPLSHGIEGATVTLQCKDRSTESLTVETDAVTDKNGEYSIKVVGDHSRELCEVHLKSPGKDGCNEIVAELNTMRIVLSSDVGVTGPIRKADALGYMSSKVLDTCADTLKSLDIITH